MQGFLSFSRGNFACDFLAVALLAVLPLLAYSIYQVKVKKNYSLHKKLQIFISGALAVAIVVFELDIRLNGWRQFAEQSPFFNTLVFPALYIHIAIAVLTLGAWAVTLVGALRKFSSPAKPGVYSPQHKKMTKFASMGLFSTAVSGWVFFYLAFVA